MVFGRIRLACRDNVLVVCDTTDDVGVCGGGGISCGVTIVGAISVRDGVAMVVRRLCRMLVIAIWHIVEIRNDM